MTTLLKDSVQLRALRADDAEMIFAWRNHPEIVALASSQQRIGWMDHQRWIARSVAGVERVVFVVLCDGEPAGQVRFDWTSEGEGEISVYLLPPFTGRGLGVAAIRQGCEKFFREHRARRIVAWIRVENTRSVAAFHKAGFVETRGAPTKDQHFRLVLNSTLSEDHT